MPLKGDAGFRYNSAESENLLTFSSQFDNAAWTKTRSTITADATTAPDGTTTADKLVEDSSSATSHLISQSFSASLSDDTQSVVSFYAKAAERSWLAVQVVDKNGDVLLGYVDLTNVTTGTVDAGLSFVLTSLSNGWVRVAITFDSDAGASDDRLIIGLAQSNGGRLYSGDGTSGVYLWGASLTEVTPVEVALEFPLFRPTVGSAKPRFEAWSLSRKNREVVTIGDGVDELRATIRFHDDAYEILRMLEAGADGVELTYFPSLAAGIGYPAQLVEPSGETLEVLRDSSSLGKIGRVEVPVRLRRVDGGSWDGVI